MDAAIFPASGLFSVAGIARDSNGLVLEAFSKCSSGRIAPELAEAIGVKEALSWIKDRQWKSVLIETDCILIVQSLRSATPLNSYFGSVITDCLNIWSQVPTVDIVFVKRSTNKAVHSLARSSCFIADRFLLYKDLDDVTKSALFQDCT